MNNNTIPVSENGLKQDTNRDARDTKPILGNVVSLRGSLIGKTPRDNRDTRDTFPVEVFPESAKRLIDEAAASVVCPPEMVGLPMLVALASAIGNSRIIKIKSSWTESPALYAALISDPGTKKSPAAKVGMGPAHRLQARLLHDYRMLKQEELCEELTPVLQRTVVDDTTPEALVKVLSENVRGLLVAKDELSSWIRGMDRYTGKGIERQFYLSLWSGEAVYVDRKSEEEATVLPRPYASIYGTIQPSVLHELSERQDGMVDRFLVSYPDPFPSRWSDQDVSEEATEAVFGLYQELRDLGMEQDEYGVPVPTQVGFDHDAKEVFKELIDEHRAEMYAVGFPGKLQGPWSKLEAYFGRLTLIMALLHSPNTEQVNSRDVLRALQLLRYFKHQARKVYGELQEPDELDQLARKVGKFLVEVGGHYKGEPSDVLRKVWGASSFDGNFTRKVKALAKRTPSLKVVSGKSNGRRYLSLTLENGVPGVPHVPLVDTYGHYGEGHDSYGVG